MLDPLLPLLSMHVGPSPLLDPLHFSACSIPFLSLDLYSYIVCVGLRRSISQQETYQEVKDFFYLPMDGLLKPPPTIICTVLSINAVASSWGGIGLCADLFTIFGGTLFFKVQGGILKEYQTM